MPYSRLDLEAFTVAQLKVLADYLEISYNTSTLKGTLVDAVLDKQIYTQEYLEGLTLEELKDIAGIKIIADYETMTEEQLISAILATQV
ncbi:hypothetical protein OSC52_15280 [Clostridium pasteurianum]|uniref:hypothetical protein n=1 Tax=Clostridium pasteurianum TaxID=1501 RepID=UPI0022609606|nr:hypothetical protein [Clostridium pasteurianum]UZW13198.1 hypothetical protein OSC52_15280 [Clostridium pasteurianum]